MKVRGAWSQRVGNFRERQIVCGYQPNRTVLEQVARNGLRANPAIV